MYGGKGGRKGKNVSLYKRGMSVSKLSVSKERGMCSANLLLHG